MAVHAQQHVVQRAQLGEQPDVLKGAGEAAARNQERLHAGDVLPVQRDLSLGGRIDAGDDVEQCGLACAVWSDDADDLALFNMDIDIGQRSQAAELLSDPGHRQDTAHFASPAFCCSFCFARCLIYLKLTLPRMPSGLTIISTTMMMP